MTTDLYTIGIDPGKDTGFAVYDRKITELVELKTLDFVTTLDSLIKRYSPDSVFAVVVEVPNTKGNFTKEKDDSGIKNHNIGRVCREAELMALMCEYHGYRVIRQHPKGKIDKHKFKRITGWAGRTNPHTRDAGMLCLGL